MAGFPTAQPRFVLARGRRDPAEHALILPPPRRIARRRSFARSRARSRMLANLSLAGFLTFVFVVGFASRIWLR